MKLYTKIKNKLSLYEFLKEGFTSDPIIRGPARRLDIQKFVATYKDEKCENLECKPARRSMEDLIVISQTMFPGATEKDVMEMIFKLHDDGVNIATLYCPDILKHIFYVSPYNREDLKQSKSWMHYLDKNGRGKYTLVEIFQTAKRDLFTLTKYEKLYPLKIN